LKKRENVLNDEKGEKKSRWNRLIGGEQRKLFVLFFYSRWGRDSDSEAGLGKSEEQIYLTIRIGPPIEREERFQHGGKRKGSGYEGKKDFNLLENGLNFYWKGGARNGWESIGTTLSIFSGERGE